MDYVAAQRADEPQGRGAMKSTCRQYQCRFQRPRQFWSGAGDEALMCLETFWRNQRGHLLFPHIIRGDPAKIEMRPFGTIVPPAEQPVVPTFPSKQRLQFGWYRPMLAA